MSLKIGMDIGSTTIKVVVLNDNGEIIYKSYERHLSKVRQMALKKIEELEDLLSGQPLKVALTGSAGLGISKQIKLDFVQEVFATAMAVRKYEPKADVVIELGGEDAKIIFLKGGIEERMNSTCAGGTGSFIDQMASLLNVDLTKLDELSLRHEKIYPIASRCGVFAKTDIQPLINQGAQKMDIAASIFQAVVEQTIAGLAQGKKIEGNILFLGGPLSFLKGLQQRFVESLNLTQENAIFPSIAAHFIALGAAVYSQEGNKTYTYEQIYNKFSQAMVENIEIKGMPPLFENQADYDAFLMRHKAADVKRADLKDHTGRTFLGIDAGSTTTKLVLIDEDENILYESYAGNGGNPVEAVRTKLLEIYNGTNSAFAVTASASTGYGEDLVKSAFNVNYGIVETIAHSAAAKHFNPNVDFIIDIGGQDMKCFRLKNGAIDHIVINEACSSGCGSFVETFSKSLGYDIGKFAKLGCFAKNPVDLGSRCTVFMNSSVKEAQKNGATPADISAGLAVSVVKNVLYKVIRAKSKDEIGENIVVQGGTFLNDSVLRGFENELGRFVVRPKISGLMGAYGAALYAKNAYINIDRDQKQESAFITRDELMTFTHSAKAANCNLCTNNCHLTINMFGGSKKHIAGNRCQRPMNNSQQIKEIPDLFAYKYKKLLRYQSDVDSKRCLGKRGTVAIPMVLNMYENLPFWYEFFTRLDFKVMLSGISSKQMYIRGQNSITSDTVCYGAKLVHGHIAELLRKGAKLIFYPAMTYNIDEQMSDNNFNCPVVAYYPEVIGANSDLVNSCTYFAPYISLTNKSVFEKKMRGYLLEIGYDIDAKTIKNASSAAYKSYEDYKNDVFAEGARALKYAEDNNLKVAILAGRPYHIDPEINHGINKLLVEQGFVVVTEDAIPKLGEYKKLNVLNQWTYHARVYNSAKFVCENPNANLIQLVSFGCGLDAITTDEVADILEKKGKLYTQIKIDEIDNLGAAKIRVRSLVAAIEERI